MSLTRTIDASVEPLDLVGSRHHLRVDHSVDDDEIAAMLTAARQAAENYTRRAFIEQTWQLTLDRFPCQPITLPRPRLISVESITYLDDNGEEQTLAEQLYRVSPGGEPARITPTYGQSWPSIRCVTDAVRITFKAGYGQAAADVPAPIVQAVKLLLGHYYSNRSSVVVGTISAELPQAVEWLLEPFRFRGFP